MAPQVEHIGNGLYMIDAHMFGAPENLSTYVIPEPVPTLIEPGPTTCHEFVMAGLAELGLDELATVVVTHIHLDHAGGTGNLLERFPESDVYVHTAGARHLVDPSRLVASATRIYGEDGMRDMWGEMRPVPESRLHAVDDGDRIAVGEQRHLDVMYTPGHAKHHMSLVDSETGVIMIGDSVGITFPDLDIVHPAVPPPDIEVELLISQFARYTDRTPYGLGFAHFGLRRDVGHVLEESERRLRMWTGIVAAHAGESPEDLGTRLSEANRADLVSHGHAHAHIERMQERTDFATEAGGLLRYVHTHSF